MTEEESVARFGTMCFSTDYMKETIEFGEHLLVKGRHILEEDIIETIPGRGISFAVWLPSIHNERVRSIAMRAAQRAAQGYFNKFQTDILKDVIIAKIQQIASEFMEQEPYPEGYSWA